MSNPPQVALWLSVPGNCRMRGDFEVGVNEAHDIHVILGSNGDDTHLLFEREALERFVELAQRMLAVPRPRIRTAPPPTVLESSYGRGVQEVSAPHPERNGLPGAT